MSTKSFKKAELRSIYDIYSIYPDPLPEDFKRHTVKEANEILFNRLRADGYTGPRRVSVMMEFIDEYDTQMMEVINEMRLLMNLPVESATQVAHSQRQELFDEFNGLMNLPSEESTQIPQLDRLYRYQESVKEANAVSDVDESAIVNECVTDDANGYPVYYHPGYGVTNYKKN